MTLRELMLQTVEATKTACEDWNGGCDVCHDYSRIDAGAIVDRILYTQTIAGPAKDKLNSTMIDGILDAMRNLAIQAKTHAELLESLQVRLAKAERTIHNLRESMMGDAK